MRKKGQLIDKEKQEISGTRKESETFTFFSAGEASKMMKRDYHLSDPK